MIDAVNSLIMELGCKPDIDSFNKLKQIFKRQVSHSKLSFNSPLQDFEAKIHSNVKSHEHMLRECRNVAFDLNKE